jgi:hypothetical protein
LADELVFMLSEKHKKAGSELRTGCGKNWGINFI